MKGFDLENLRKYLKKINNLDVKIEIYDDDGDIWRIILDRKTGTEIAVSRSVHPSKLEALVEAEKNISGMIQADFQRQCFKEEYGIV